MKEPVKVDIRYLFIFGCDKCKKEVMATGDAGTTVLLCECSRQLGKERGIWYITSPLHSHERFEDVERYPIHVRTNIEALWTCPSCGKHNRQGIDPEAATQKQQCQCGAVLERVAGVFTLQEPQKEPETVKEVSSLPSDLKGPACSSCPCPYRNSLQSGNIPANIGKSA